MRYRYRTIILPFFGLMICASYHPSPGGREDISKPQTEAAERHDASKQTQRGAEQLPLNVQIVTTPKSDEVAAAVAKDAHDQATDNRHLVFITGALAFLAFLQWCAMIWQGQSIGRQVRLGREEFIASHRPRIILRDVFVDDGCVLYMIVNVGGSPARIIESWVMTEFHTDVTAIRNLRSVGHHDLGDLKLAAGQICDLTCGIDAETSLYLRFGPNSMRLTPEGRAKAGNLYFTGALVYEDTLGTRRRSVFRRRWDDQRNGFYRTDDPDHEYAD